MARSALLVAAKVKLYVNGRPFGHLSSFSWDSSTPVKAIYGIDQTGPIELAATTHKVTGHMNIYRLSGDGGAEGGGLMAPLSELSRTKYFSLLLVEIGTNVVLFEARKCMATSQSWGADRGYIMGSVGFEAIDWSNEVREFQT